MRAEDIVIGKTYRVRSREDIEQNCIEVKRGSIVRQRRWRDPESRSPVMFVEHMFAICGMYFTVNEIRGIFHEVRSEERVEFRGGSDTPLIVVPWMLEEIEEEIVAEPDRDLFGFLFQNDKRETAVPES